MRPTIHIVIFLLGAFRGLWFLLATGATAFCYYEHAWLGMGLWVLSTFLVNQIVNALARPFAPRPVDYDAIGDRVYERMAERVDGRR